MAQLTFETVLAQAEQLTPQDRLRLVEWLAAKLQTDFQTKLSESKTGSGKKVSDATICNLPKSF